MEASKHSRRLLAPMPRVQMRAVHGQKVLVGNGSQVAGGEDPRTGLSSQPPPPVHSHCSVLVSADTDVCLIRDRACAQSTRMACPQEAASLVGEQTGQQATAIGEAPGARGGWEGSLAQTVGARESVPREVSSSARPR